MATLAGACFFSTKAIFVKLAYLETDIDTITLLTLRMVIASPFFIIVAWLNKTRNIEPSAVGITTYLWVLIVGILGYYISSFLNFYGLKTVSAGLERLILFIYPTFVLLFTRIIFKGIISRKQSIAVLLTYAGLIVVFLNETSIAEVDMGFIIGSGYVFLSAVTYAFYIIGSGRLIPKIGPLAFNSFAMLSACFGILLHYIFVSQQSVNRLFSLPPQVYIYGFQLALISTVIPSYLIAYGVKRIGSGNAAIASSIGPVGTIGLAYFFLGEAITLMTVIGTAFIIFGVVLIGVKK